MPIALAPVNTTLRILKVLLGEKEKKHLESLGIMPNAEVTLSSSSNGGVILIVKGVRLALDRSVASKILVA